MTGVSLLEGINGLMQAERWRQAIALCMSERPEALTADVLWNWAWAHFKLGQFPASKGLFERALELRPEAPLMLWGLGVTLRELGDLDEAKRRFRRALERSGDLAESVAPRKSAHSWALGGASM